MLLAGNLYYFCVILCYVFLVALTRLKLPPYWFPLLLLLLMLLMLLLLLTKQYVSLWHNFTLSFAVALSGLKTPPYSFPLQLLLLLRMLLLLILLLLMLFLLLTRKYVSLRGNFTLSFGVALNSFKTPPYWSPHLLLLFLM